MNDFKETLYESMLYSFGKILSEYDVFAQDTILKEIGKEIIEYLKRHDFEFEETGSIEDISTLVSMFVKNGFSDLEISTAEKGEFYKWKNLYGIGAYAELHKITDNPFLSCPLNACIYYIADKHGKTLKFHSKSFDLAAGLAESQEEIVDREDEHSEGFNPLIIENKRLFELAEQHNRELTKALAEVKKLQNLLPICANCKKIRDEKGYWNQIESYIESRTDTKFSHGLCGECVEQLYGDEDWYKK
ncbi:MAG: hypothetical protein ABFQ82_02820 [Thermodesulfobacteriota bacterium]